MADLLFFAGSLRSGSFNKKLLNQAAIMAENLGASVNKVDLRDFPMPIYDGDIEATSGLPDAAKQLKKICAASSGFFIASPEYNSSISGILKNTIDWVSRTDPANPDLQPFSGKVAAISAASPGALGGLRGLVVLRMLLGNLGMLVVPQQYALSFADKAFDDSGALLDLKNKAALENVVKQLVKYREV
jgi:chromate reductase